MCIFAHAPWFISLKLHYEKSKMIYIYIYFFFSVVCQAQNTCLVAATVIYLQAEWKKVPRSAAVVQALVAVALALPWQPRSKQGFA